MRRASISADLAVTRAIRNLRKQAERLESKDWHIDDLDAMKGELAIAIDNVATALDALKEMVQS